MVSVLEKDVPLVSKGMTATMTVDAYPGKIFRGNVARLSQAIDLGTRTMMVEIDVPNREHFLKGGMFATVDAIVAVHDTVITLPAEAVLKDGNSAYVYVADGSVAQREELRRGDVITAVDDTEIHRPLDFQRAMLDCHPNQHIRLAVRRGNDSLSRLALAV